MTQALQAQKKDTRTVEESCAVMQQEGYCVLGGEGGQKDPPQLQDTPWTLAGEVARGVQRLVQLGWPPVMIFMSARILLDPSVHFPHRLCECACVK